MSEKTLGSSTPACYRFAGGQWGQQRSQNQISKDQQRGSTRVRSARAHTNSDLKSPTVRSQASFAAASLYLGVELL